MLRWLKTVVVSDAEKAHKMRQVGIGKTVRSLEDEIAVEVSLEGKGTSKPGLSGVPWDEPGGCPLTGRVVSGTQAT